MYFPFPLRFSCTLLFVCAGFVAWSQSLRGVVTDAARHSGLRNARIVAVQQPAAQLRFEAIADSMGRFSIPYLPPAYYECLVEAEGYEPLLVQELLVAAGKEQVLDFALHTLPQTLPDVTIRAAPLMRKPLQPLSEISLTREQTLRYPATFFDPARLAFAYAGVANTDDQANGISIRGNSPNSVRWRLEGVEIVNPNHLPNAGTFTDQPALNSGGVLLFSAQLLDNSSLLTGNFPAGYANSVGGIFDMYWRKGNDRHHEFTTQAGLLGLDVAAEGPLGKRERGNSYLVNTRYSTVGLLGQMGISFGGEKIDFGDFSYKLSLKGRKNGQWDLFGVWGISKNILNVSDDRVFQRDLMGVAFSSNTHIHGLSYTKVYRGRTFYRMALVVSRKSSSRAVTDGEQWLSMYSLRNLENRYSKLGMTHSWTRTLNKQHNLSVGLQTDLTGDYYRVSFIFSPGNGLFAEGGSSIIATPWLRWNGQSKNQQWQWQAGLQTTFLHNYYAPSDFQPLPSLSLSRKLGAQRQLSVAYGLYSEQQPNWMYEHEKQYMQQAQHLAFQYRQQFGPRWHGKVEVFGQWTKNVATGRIYDSGLKVSVPFSIVNTPEMLYEVLLDQFIYFDYNGHLSRSGVETSLSRTFAGDWFLLSNITLLNTKYHLGDGVWHNSRWDIGHIFNLTAGREWNLKSRAPRNRSFGINGRFTWTGGQRMLPINLETSKKENRTIFQYGQPPGDRLPDFIRLDARLYWKWHLDKRLNSTFAMDIQNASIRRNVAYQYYDAYTEKIETKYQLGLVPNLSWRFEF